jgi:hypothetical protein
MVFILGFIKHLGAPGYPLIFAGGALALAATLAAGLIIFIVKGARLLIEPCSKRRGWSILGSISLCSLLAVWVAPTVFDVGTLASGYAKLKFKRSEYEAIIHLLAGDAALIEDTWRQASTSTFSVDRGPPVRVAFDPVGLLDNWSGIVFDSSDQVHGIGSMTADLATSLHLGDLFGGDLVRCRHLKDHYYLCDFN